MFNITTATMLMLLVNIVVTVLALKSQLESFKTEATENCVEMEVKLNKLIEFLIPNVNDMLDEYNSQLVDVINSYTQLVVKVIKVMTTNLKSMLFKILGTQVRAVYCVFDTATSMLANYVNSHIGDAQSALASAASFSIDACNGVTQTIDQVTNTATTVVSDASNTVTDVGNTVTDVGQTITSTFGGFFGKKRFSCDDINALKDKISAIIPLQIPNGISSQVDAWLSQLTSFIVDLVDQDLPVVTKDNLGLPDMNVNVTVSFCNKIDWKGFDDDIDAIVTMLYIFIGVYSGSIIVVCSVYYVSAYVRCCSFGQWEPEEEEEAEVNEKAEGNEGEGIEMVENEKREEKTENEKTDANTEGKRGSKKLYLEILLKYNFKVRVGILIFIMISVATILIYAQIMALEQAKVQLNSAIDKHITSAISLEIYNLNTHFQIAVQDINKNFLSKLNDVTEEINKYISVVPDGLREGANFMSTPPPNIDTSSAGSDPFSRFVSGAQSCDIGSPFATVLNALADIFPKFQLPQLDLEVGDLVNPNKAEKTANIFKKSVNGSIDLLIFTLTQVMQIGQLIIIVFIVLIVFWNIIILIVKTKSDDGRRVEISREWTIPFTYRSCMFIIWAVIVIRVAVGLSGVVDNVNKTMKDKCSDSEEGLEEIAQLPGLLLNNFINKTVSLTNNVIGDLADNIITIPITFIDIPVSLLTEVWDVTFCVINNIVVGGINALLSELFILSSVFVGSVPNVEKPDLSFLEPIKQFETDMKNVVKNIPKLNADKLYYPPVSVQICDFSGIDEIFYWLKVALYVLIGVTILIVLGYWTFELIAIRTKRKIIRGVSHFLTQKAYTISNNDNENDNDYVDGSTDSNCCSNFDGRYFFTYLFYRPALLVIATAVSLLILFGLVYLLLGVARDQVPIAMNENVKPQLEDAIILFNSKVSADWNNTMANINNQLNQFNGDLTAYYGTIMSTSNKYLGLYDEKLQFVKDTINQYVPPLGDATFRFLGCMLPLDSFRNLVDVASYVTTFEAVTLPQFPTRFDLLMINQSRAGQITDRISEKVISVVDFTQSNILQAIYSTLVFLGVGILFVITGIIHTCCYSNRPLTANLVTIDLTQLGERPSSRLTTPRQTIDLSHLNIPIGSRTNTPRPSKYQLKETKTTDTNTTTMVTTTIPTLLTPKDDIV